jgi:mRNA-degrading endonuclease YafQ of YafQ-DinJ toxin-antitoxin module
MPKKVPNDKIVETVKKHVTKAIREALYPSKSTEQAMLRLRAGKGVQVDTFSFIDLMQRVYPEYDLSSLKKEFLERAKHKNAFMSRIMGAPYTSSEDKKYLVDTNFERKLALVKKHYKLTMSEVETFTNNVDFLVKGANLKRRFHHHALVRNLAGYFSFLVHLDTSDVPDEKKKSVICLYTRIKGQMALANIGYHDMVYAKGPITS